MSRAGLSVRVGLLVVCTFLFTSLLHAQYRTSIQGVVTDPTGAVVTGAKLTLTNPATGESWVRNSNDSGVYNFNALAAAPFRLVVEKQGFKKKLLENLQLVPEQPNGVDIELELGTESETVSVNATDLPPLDTETASVNGVISSNQVQHLPSFGRDPLKLIQLAPGVMGDSAQGAGGDGFNLPGTETGGGPSGHDDSIFKTESGAQVTSNGNQTPFNSYSVDGISTESAVWGGTTVITPSEDSIDSVKIVSNSYDAEVGRFTGTQIQITSKGGTNQYHGSAFFTVHRPGLNAYQPWNGPNTPSPVQRDTSRFNQIGGSFGGPIWKNKIFGFFNYETIREHSTNTSTQWAETTAFDALTAGPVASAIIGYPGNNILGTPVASVTCASAGLVSGTNCLEVSGGLNIGKPLDTTAFPTGMIGATEGYPTGGMDPSWANDPAHPGLGGNGSGGTENLGTIADITQYNASSPNHLSEVQYNGRLDANVTGKDHIGFAIYWVPITHDWYNGNRAIDVFHHTQINDAFSAIWDHTFSPTLLNEVRANAAGWRWNEIKDNPQSPVGIPQAAFDSNIGSVSINMFGPSLGSHLDQWTYSYKDVATKIIGPHTIKFGGEVTRLSYLSGCFGCTPGGGFWNLWDFLNDVPKRQGYTFFDPHTGKPTTGRQDDRQNILGFFVQDDYKIRPNLTLNLGLRWSYFGPLYDKNGGMYVAHPGAGANYLTGLTVSKGNAWKAQKTNFGPELGFAWSPGAFHDKLVFRGGYGLNYGQEEIALTANINNNPGTYLGEWVSMNLPTDTNPGILWAVSSDPKTYDFPANPCFQFNYGSNGLPTGTSGCGLPSAGAIDIFPDTMPTLRVHHYSFDLQYDLGHQLVASLGYQGSVARNIEYHQNPLAYPASQGWAMNPALNGGGDYWSSEGKANYNAMLAEVKHNFSRQFMADVQYAWAKSLDNTSRPYNEPYYPFNPDMSYGRSDFNIGHSFKIFGMWQPVFFHGNSLLSKVADGWSVSGIFNWHSGFPWSPVAGISGGSLYCGQCGYTTLYPAAYLGGAGHSTSNGAFIGNFSSNFPLENGNPNGAEDYFAPPVNCNTESPKSSATNDCYTTYSGSDSGSANPPSPGVGRNSLNLPGYKAIDLTLAKAFGLPNIPGIGEGAKFEFRVDAYNVFNTLNLNPNSISNNIASSNFGTISNALGSRTVTMGLRFSF
ncbi:MAG TPA: TonB-dependent receptor [Terriglobales bacterium]|nr:TonB-dependent receptor [Terriglobales bacterium]